MTKLVELNSKSHQGLKVRPNCHIAMAANQQIMKLRVTETSKAVTSFPVFFTREQRTGAWVLSALTSLENGSNLFVREQQWDSAFLPSSMQTYPLFLMQSEKQENSFTIGVLEQSAAFSKETGEPLFDTQGRATLYLSRIQKLLEADIKNDMQTSHFCQKLEELGLLKSINLVIQFQDDSVQHLNGLHTLDEDKLHALSAEQLAELNKLGYLIPIHAMLISIYQLNTLVKKNNELHSMRVIKQLKIEVMKDRAIA
ncbi:SapC family protein [uncultured Paraglaciecola sp.]|uniref:SapC family protein n=1 Tax=uncultured Paraglaciecola sp. TaxID=1765024 RepID=UPI0026175C65|nr:SapC family protein [uncultured Paraglaciecola sp.]